jgi:hypothetical protein
VATAVGALRVCTALLQSGQTAENASLSSDYIESLLAARDLIKEVRDDQKIQQRTLFYLLLRHSMLLEYAAAASRLLSLEPALRREPELVDLPVGQLTQTVWRQMEKM